MRIINKGRGQGKTLQLLYASELTGYRIICGSFGEAKNLKKWAEELNLDIPEPMAYVSYVDLKGIREEKILIDNVEEILDKALSAYFKKDICAVTMSVPMKDSELNTKKASANERCLLYMGCPCRTASCYGLPDEGCPVYRWFKKLIEDNEMKE